MNLARTVSISAWFLLCGIALGAESDRLGRFDRDRDLYLAHFDLKTDVDDVQAVAAVATMLADPRFSSVSYHAVAGTYGLQEGEYVPAEGVFDLAFGGHWSDAHEDFDSALDKVSDLSMKAVNDGGSIWIADGGQSDFSAALVRSIQEQLPGVALKARITVVQHADWNEEVTTPEDLEFLKKTVSYQKIPSGNGIGNGSPGFRTMSSVNWRDHINDSRLKKTWALAIEVANRYNGAEDRYLNEAIQAGGLDFSDVAETTWIFGFSDLADAHAFFAEFSDSHRR